MTLFDNKIVDTTEEPNAKISVKLWKAGADKTDAAIQVEIVAKFNEIIAMVHSICDASPIYAEAIKVGIAMFEDGAIPQEDIEKEVIEYKASNKYEN